jgi:hypothetical protein
MRPRTVPTAVLAAVLAVSSTGSAAVQLAQPGQPLWIRAGQRVEAPPVLVAPPDVPALLAEDEARGNRPYRYGAVLPVAFDSGSSGAWQVLPGGELAWSLRILSPGARSLGLLLDRYELPASGKVFVYDASGATVLGAFTRETRQPNGMLAIQPVAGDELVIEYTQDASDPGRPELRVGEVVYDYRGILDAIQPGSPLVLSLANCLFDVRCFGTDYDDIKRSVIMVLAGGGLCSAGLLNNSARDGVPYFLTAEHCGNMTNVVAVFDYENTACGGGGASQSKTLSGATLLASSVNVDSQLYRLAGNPPRSYRPFFAGWDRNATQSGPTVSISHPSGNPKKLARFDRGPIRSGVDYIAIWDTGTLEGGSSGSPLFNGSQRVIGPACCVSSFSCGNQWAYYGRFGRFWAEGALAQWLDPIGSAQLGIDGFDPFRGEALPYNGSGLNPELYRSTSPPNVGSTWTHEVDTSLFAPNASTWTLGYLAPSSGTFVAMGEWLVDRNSAFVFKSVVRASGGVAAHSTPIPNQAALIGTVTYCQARIFAGGGVLTNGIAITVR